MASCKGVLPMDPMATLATIQVQREQSSGVDLAMPGCQGAANLPMEDPDPDISEVYFLVMHFLAGGPCSRAFFQLWNELLQHKLLPRRFHAWHSRGGTKSGDENDDGVSFPLSYSDIKVRHPDIEQGHLVKLLKQLLVYNRKSVAAEEPGNSRIPTASDVPTLLGTGVFSLLELEKSKASNEVPRLTRQLRWPHWQADQVHGLMLRELGGGFARHHRGPSIRTASYVVTKPVILVDRIKIIKKLRGHRNAVYCAVFDNSGQYVITGSDDRLVKIWSTETGLCLRSCRGHEGDITDMAVSSGNSLVASASNDHSIRVWALPTGVPVSVLRGHNAAVTAIAFSPRQGCEHLLLSTSDDGTCRIWNAKDSTLNSRVYMPNPRDIATALRGVGILTPPPAPVNNPVLCCAFNADGSIFVTGSSDKMARVWDARKWNDDVTGRPNYELDTLRGHEHDVNYVQFSGCAAPARPTPTDVVKDEYPSQFKNSWFAHDSIVTCSRDGSAIIWTPRPRKYHGKVGRWQKAYHLRVPPPPLPPQPPRGNGPRQRLLPTPRGVNMIVWSLDNRFVLAAIMDHRICVWNAIDGSLVHSLTGHDKQTYVLDVHPFNPRIAMSAGYDGRVIIWDIWEGHPIKVYETGEYNLVDGNFSPDGASLVVSDEVGQIYIFGTGPEMSSKDVKYDQFFLGDFRPLIRDTFGNVLDMETQLAPHRRNVQDLLCDANLIPYPEPYQGIYQQRRLGALGIEWSPPSVHLAIGNSDDAAFTMPTEQLVPSQLVVPPPIPEPQDRQGLVISGGNRWVEQPSEAEETMDWEPEVAGFSEDTGSEYSASEESQSEAEGKDQVGESLDEEGFASDEDQGGEDKDGLHLRRSCRNKRKTEEFTHTASGRRVRRRKFNDDDSSEQRPHRRQCRTSRLGPANFRATQSPVPIRPQRQAARNASNFSTSANISQDVVIHQRSQYTIVQEQPQTPSELQSTPDGEGTAAGSENEEAVLQVPVANSPPEFAGEVAELIQDGLEEVNMDFPEVPDSVAEYRRPRSQRRIILRVRSENADPTVVALEGNRVRSTDVAGRHNEHEPAVGASGAAENHDKAPTLLQPEGPSMRTVRKLVVKPPIRLVDTALEAGELERKQGFETRNSEAVKQAKALLLDSDDELSLDEKQTWEWKKVKAAKRARGSGSPDLRVSSEGDSMQKGDASPNMHSTCSSLNSHPLEPNYISELPQSRAHIGVGSSSSLPMAGATLMLPASNRKLLAENNDDQHVDDELQESREAEAENFQEAENLKVTCVENKGSEASMDDLDLPKWRQARQAGPCTRRRVKNSHVDLSHADDELQAGTSFSKAAHRERRRQIGTDELGDDAVEPEEDIEMENSGNEAGYVETGELLLDESEPEPNVYEKGDSSANCVEDEEGGDSLLSLKNERVSLREHEAAESLHETSEMDDPPPVMQYHLRGVKNPPVYEESDEEVEEEPDSEKDEDEDEDEDGDEEKRDSDVYEGTQASTHEWSGTENESDDESIDLGRKVPRPKRQRALRELGSYARQTSTSYQPERSILDLSIGKTRIRHMHAVLSESGRGTRSRSSRGPSTWTQSMTTATPLNVHGIREASGQGSRQKRSKLQQKTANIGATNDRSLRVRQTTRNQGIQSASDIERPLRASTRSRGILHGDLNESENELTRHLDYDSGEVILRRSSSRGKQDFERREKGKALANVANGLASSARGQRGRKSKLESRSLENVAWLLLEEVEPGTRFIPQFGDEVVYLRQGHQDFLEESHIDEKGPWKTLKQPVRAVEFCCITGLEYVVDKESGKLSCKIDLEFTDSNSRVFGKNFKLSLPELTNYPDFLVERSRFDASLETSWSPRDHCQVWWASEDKGKAGSWWDGRIKQIKAKSKEFPDSPWEMYHVTYKSGSTEVTPHSPWELFNKDYKIVGWELPTIDMVTKEAVLDVISNVEQSCFRKDPYGLEQHRKVVKDSSFLSRVPLPLSWDAIWVRVEKNYYHSTDALEHDVQLLVSNTALFYGNDSEEANKMQQLADRLTGALR